VANCWLRRRLRELLARLPGCFVVLGNHDYALSRDPFSQSAELHKLADYAAGRTVNRGDVRELVVGKDVATWSLLDGLAERRTEKALTALRALYSQGESPEALLGRDIAPHYRRLMVARELSLATDAERARLSELHDDGLAFGYDVVRCVAVRFQGEEVALFAFGATLPWTLSVNDTDVSPGYAEKISAKLVQLDLAGSVPARLFTAVLFLRRR